MADLRSGDTVRLKSGGPLMTIQKLGDYYPTGPKDGAVCVWFDGMQSMEQVFDCAVLTISDNKARPLTIV